MLFFIPPMIYLIATILSSTSIYVIFRLAKNYPCKISSLITINYFVAALLGFAYFMEFNFKLLANSKQWLPYAIVLGILFIVMFFLIGNSSQKAGITITTLANKLSLVFPVLFSILYFHENISTLKYIGLATAVIAIILTVYKKEINKTNLLFILLPVAIFLGSGITDSIVKYSQAIKISENEAAVFSFLVFFVAFILAAVISLLSKKSNKINFLHPPTLFLGIVLGLVNFGSLYFIINALNKSNLNSSLVFTIINMSIVILSAIIGKILFKEKLSRFNIAGILLAILSFYFLL